MLGGRGVHLEVDGGINADTAPRIIAAGADVLVAGSAIFGTSDYRAAIAGLRPAIEA
jgi:ribulose-phosphate 3-epimerase